MGKIPVPPHLVHAVKHSEMCRRCVAEYYKLYKAGIIKDPFPVKCSGDKRVQPKGVDENWIIHNPVAWTEYEFNDPDQPTKPF